MKQKDNPMTNARPEKILHRKHPVCPYYGGYNCECGADENNQAIDECMAYTDDLLSPLEEVYKKYKYADYKMDGRQMGKTTSFELWDAIQSVLAKHKAGTGKGEA